MLILPLPIWSFSTNASTIFRLSSFDRDGHCSYRLVASRATSSADTLLTFGSEVVNDIADSEVERLGDSPQSFDSDFFLGAFDFPDVIAIEVGLLRQFFLAEFCLSALG